MDGFCSVKKSNRCLSYYQEMKRLGCKWSPDVRQIDLDVNRTYRDHTMFRKRYDEKQQQLFHVLGEAVYLLKTGDCFISITLVKTNSKLILPMTCLPEKCIYLFT